MTDEQMVDVTETETVTEFDELEQERSDVAEIGTDLARVRDLVLAANPDIVPEMVQGETFDELLDSVEPARAAYQRIVSEQQAIAPAPKVAIQPGQRGASLVDMESLSPLGKISEGLRRL